MTLHTVAADDDGQRLDRYLRKLLPSSSLGDIYKYIRTGYVRSDLGKKLKSDARVQEWDSITIPEQLMEVWDISSPKKVAAESIQRALDITSLILFEDEDIIVLNKPPGINVHPGDHKTTEVSIIELISDYLTSRKKEGLFDTALVHRLDRDTSGVLLIAKNRISLNILLEELQGHEMQKEYLAICIGTPTKIRDSIRLPLLRREVEKWAKVIVSESGQNAITHYAQIASRKWISVLRVTLETGRMHQIRVHLSEIGCPVLGDRSYGVRIARAYSQTAEAVRVTRQLLHASCLSFHHPRTNVLMKISSPIPWDMQTILSTLSISLDL